MLRVVGLALCVLVLACGSACGGDRASVASKAPADAVATGAASAEEAATTEAATTEAAPGSEAPAPVRRDPALEAVQALPARAADEVRAAVERSRGDVDATAGAPQPEAQ